MSKNIFDEFEKLKAKIKELEEENNRELVKAENMLAAETSFNIKNVEV